MPKRPRPSWITFSNPNRAKDGALAQFQNTTGAYYEYDTKTNFANFLQYAYNSKIPSVLMNPSSVRYSVWSDGAGEAQKLPASWKLPALPGRPVIVHGSEREGITPDLTSGVYYEYTLKRTLILVNHKGRQALISISKQVGSSDVGKKGFIVGNDQDWNYYYSGEPGSAMTGLGWVKSYIYSFFTVAVYVEPSPSSSVVRSGNFQWIRAGWSGVNFVKKEHIIKGMKRRASGLKTVMESPHLPAPVKIASARQQFSALPRQDLVERYASLQQARQALAVRTGKIKASEAKKQDSYGNLSKEQMVEELLVEYLKATIGKPSLLERKVVLGAEPSNS